MNVRPRRIAKAHDGSGAGSGVRPDLAGGWWREAWRGANVITHGRRGGRWAKDDPQSNNGMHPTAGTAVVKFLQWGRRGG